MNALIDKLQAAASNGDRYTALLYEAAATIRALENDADLSEDDATIRDALRYRFLRSPLASESGPIQRELWQELGVKLCREERMDAEVDAAMRLLGLVDKLMEL